MADASGGDDQLNRSGNPARPSSRTMDVQTDHTDRFPPLNDVRALKQQRTTEKCRLTKLAGKISKHMVNRGSRTILKTFRAEFSAQVNQCMMVQNNYCSAKGSIDDEDKRWVEDINFNTKRIFDNIDNYIINTSRPPSGATPGTPVRLSATSSSSSLQSNHRSSHHSSQHSSHHSSRPQTPSASVAIPSPDLARALDQEKTRRIELEKQLLQLQIQEKEKIKRAVKAERILLAADYNKVHRDKLGKVQLAAKLLEEENEKFRRELLAERKKAQQGYDEAKEKQRLLLQEQDE
ncbi:hypothetical protein GHT06_000233 [Daphnia sinensis]|uniref:Uncharacterized protein n=1 Tax=Daphnia sinensis TaxID=1820382 RepID=A0AAD5KGX7_9CRUS|nr:hypothetical protein GHT06_000233 [Daphnia sinensis]